MSWLPSYQFRRAAGTLADAIFPLNWALSKARYKSAAPIQNTSPSESSVSSHNSGNCG
jgi:hypothetical protein